MSYICKSLFLKTYLQYQHLYHLVFSHRNAIVFWTQVKQETSENIYTRVCEHVYTYAHIKRHLLQGISLYTCGAWIGKNEIHRTGPLKDRLKLAGQKLPWQLWFLSDGEHCIFTPKSFQSLHQLHLDDWSQISLLKSNWFYNSINPQTIFTATPRLFFFNNWSID